MAAAIPGIIEGAMAVAPTIIDLITRLVHGAAPAAEQKYGPQTGPVKFGDVFASVIDALQKAAGAGQISKALPADETIKLIIQAVVTSMNLNGQLAGGPDLSTTAVKQGQGVGFIAADVITIKPGQKLTIQVAA